MSFKCNCIGHIFAFMIDVFYPYLESASTWQELRYSLRSLEKNLKAEFRVWIVGDLPTWIRNVNHIPHIRSQVDWNICIYDAVSKMYAFCNHPQTSERFIRMYDDICLIGPVDEAYVSKIKAMYDWGKVNECNYSVWYQQLNESMKAVIKKGYHGWNHETHFPEVFEKNWMLTVIGMYMARERRLLTSTLYYNTIFPDVFPEVFDRDRGDGIQFFGKDSQFYHSSNGYLKSKCDGRKYLVYNDEGLNDNLKSFIEWMFPDPSRFEN